VPSESVASVTYEKKPRELDEAEEYLLQGDPDSALQVLDEYVAQSLEKAPPTSQRWAPPHAAWRAVELRQRIADSEGAAKTAGMIVERWPESRYALLAYLAKARAEVELGRSSDARGTLGRLEGLISSQTLPKRWELECRIATAEADENLNPSSRRNELEIVAREANSLPSVQARARVLVGESYLAEAARKTSGSADLRSQARRAFEEVVASEGASRATVAQAHAGLGESLFLIGADADDAAILRDAALHCLRVTTLYREQGRQMARALFFAMRSFDLMSDGQRKNEMKRELMALFPGTRWANDAKQY